MCYAEPNPVDKVIVSTRVRFARNIQGFPFVHKMSVQQAEEIIDKCKEVITSSDSVLHDVVRYIDMRECNGEEKRALVKDHLISPQMLDESLPRGIILSKDEKLSIMINEEDHIRIQSIAEGLALEKCFTIADWIDDVFEDKLNFGFDECFGYLTCCPTNIGTAMRASAMAKLDVWIKTPEETELFIDSLASLGITVRGAYGEGSKSQGNLFQISNQVTLGVSELETLEKLEDILLKVVARELAGS